MREAFINWISSLRARLIITYVLVMFFSYGLLLLLVMHPVEEFMLSREEDTLNYLAGTIGSTIRTPWPVREGETSATIQDEFLMAQLVTQRRSFDISREIAARIRLLDSSGHVLTDSDWGYPNNKQWYTLVKKREDSGSLIYNEEVLSARYGSVNSPKIFSKAYRPDEEHPGVYGSSLYLAKPILRMDPKIGRQMVAFIVYINRPINSVKDDLTNLRHFFYYGMLVSLSITIFVTVLLSGQLSAGLQAATRVARSFASGKMDQRMFTRGRDEVGQLGSAFNQMADALQCQEQLRRDLLADVSHELRTPLTAISGCADTLVDGTILEDPKTAERFLKIILRESDRLQRLVTDILELSKFQAGAITFSLRPISIIQVIEDAVEIASMHIMQDDLTIRAELPDPSEYSKYLVLGNEDRLAQALRNLLDNARHHSPSGKVITVSVEAKDDTVIVHVRDEGEGIPEEDLPWVFDRFYRAGRRGDKQSGGTGLGLKIVQQIMNAHHGNVTIKSTVGVGTTFSLHLRKAQAEAQQVQAKYEVRK